MFSFLKLFKRSEPKLWEASGKLQAEIDAKREQERLNDAQLSEDFSKALQEKLTALQTITDKLPPYGSVACKKCGETLNIKRLYCPLKINAAIFMTAYGEERFIKRYGSFDVPSVDRIYERMLRTCVCGYEWDERPNELEKVS